LRVLADARAEPLRDDEEDEDEEEPGTEGG
jgi:hypothetical protein